jgi:hypothetical protein
MVAKILGQKPKVIKEIIASNEENEARAKRKKEEADKKEFEIRIT